MRNTRPTAVTLLICAETYGVSVRPYQKFPSRHLGRWVTSAGLNEAGWVIGEVPVHLCGYDVVRGLLDHVASSAERDVHTDCSLDARRRACAVRATSPPTRACSEYATAAAFGLPSGQVGGPCVAGVTPDQRAARLRPHHPRLRRCRDGYRHCFVPGTTAASWILDDERLHGFKHAPSHFRPRRSPLFHFGDPSFAVWAYRSPARPTAG